MAKPVLPLWLKEALAYCDAWLPEMFEASQEVGLSIALVYKGDVIYDKAFGKANIALNEPLTPRHRLRYASHSKTITSTLILKLCEEGKLRLDEPLPTYLPWLKKNPAYASQTLREVLSHTTGTLRDGEDSSFWDYGRPFPDEAELKAFFLKAKPVMEPGTQHKYSNFGFSLADLVIEAVTKKTYASVAQAYIFNPLKLKSMGFGMPKGKPYPVATGYSCLIEGKRYPFNPTLNAGHMQGVTGVYAAPSDMARLFYQIVMGKNLLTRRSQNTMQAPLFNVDESWKSEDWYGLGLGVVRHDGMKRYRHGGGYPGFLTDTEVCPDLEIGLSVGFNSLSAENRLVARGIFELLKFFRDERGLRNKFSKYEGRFYTLWGNGFGLLATRTGLCLTDPCSMRPVHDTPHAKWEKNRFVLQGKSLNMPYLEPLEVELKQGKPVRCKYAGFCCTADKKAFLKQLEKAAPHA